MKLQSVALLGELLGCSVGPFVSIVMIHYRWRSIMAWLILKMLQLMTIFCLCRPAPRPPPPRCFLVLRWAGLNCCASLEVGKCHLKVSPSGQLCKDTDLFKVPIKGWRWAVNHLMMWHRDPHEGLKTPRKSSGVNSVIGARLHLFRMVWFSNLF